MKVVLEQLAQPYLIRIVEENKETIDNKLKEVWKTKKDSITLKGFRKGSVPQDIAEKMLGFTGLYKEYIDELLSEAVILLGTEQSATIVDLQQVIPEKLDKDGIVMQAVVYLKPKVLSLDYSNVFVAENKAEVSDQDVLSRLSQLQTQYQTQSSVTDRGVLLGDTIVVTYVGSLNGVPFEGGKAVKQSLTLQEGMFIPGFGESILGMTTGEQKTFEVTFPEAYHVESLAGMVTSFDMMVHEIAVRKLPDLDDEFAKTCGHENLEELKTATLAELTTEVAKYNRSKYEDAICSELFTRAEIAPIPSSMVQKRLGQLLQQELNTYNLSQADYLKQRKIDKATFDRAYYSQALKDLKIQLILDYVAEKEELTSSEEERTAYVKEEAAKSGYTVQQVKKMATNEQIDAQIKLSKAYDYLLASALNVNSLLATV